VRGGAATVIRVSGAACRVCLSVAAEALWRSLPLCSLSVVSFVALGSKVVNGGSTMTRCFCAPSVCTVVTR